MKISIIGTGYVGLTTGACLAHLGHKVICVDIIEEKIKKLKQGIIPIYEPGLEELVHENIKNKRLIFTTDTKAAVENSDVIFITVGTPSDKDGRVDLCYIKQVAKDISNHIKSYKVIVNKSTVPPGTAILVKNIIKECYKGDFDIVSNPEFLREGKAINDFMYADRVLIGTDSEKARKIMEEIYKPLLSNSEETKFLVTKTESAELANMHQMHFCPQKFLLSMK